MPRVTTARFLKAALAQSTGELPVALLRLTHADLADPILVNTSGVDLVSNGETFLACPFGIELPPDENGRLSQAQAWIDNIEPAIMAALRSISSPATGELSIVLYDTPDDIEVGPYAFTLRDVNADELVIQGRLAFMDWLADGYPKDTINPVSVPGSF